MAVRITVDIRDLLDLPRRVAALVDVKDSARLRAELATVALRQHQQRFDRREAPDGTPWEPRRDNRGHPILEETGRLRRSMHRVMAGGGDSVFGVGTRGVDYAGVHQAGSATIPPRPFLGFGNEDLAELAITAEGWLARHVGALLR